MARIVSGELHHNENSSIQFGAAIVAAVRQVRVTVALLADSRKADEYAPGALFALKQLCEGERDSARIGGHIHRQEVEEWRTAFSAWFRRVQRHYLGDCAVEFQKNLDEAFRAILVCAGDMPDSFWRPQIAEREIAIKFPNKQALDAARQAADEKHPVHPGNALSKYLQRCIATLVEPSAATPPPAEQAVSGPPREQLVPRFSLRDDGAVTLLLDCFGCFDSPDDLAQDIVTNAYDLEEAVRRYLTEHRPDVLTDLRFDCESSLFCVRSAQSVALAAVTEILIRFVSDRHLYVQYRSQAEGA